MCPLPNLALSLPSVSQGKKTPTQGLGHRGSAWLPAGTWGQALRMSLQLGAGEGGGESLLIYLWPWHSPWGGAPPRAGTDGVPGSPQCLSSRCHPPGETVFVILPGSHEGRGLWRSWDLPGQRALREGAGPRLPVYPLHSPLCLSPWPCSWQVHVLASSQPCQASPLPWDLSGSSPFGLFLSVLSPPFLCLSPAAPPKTKDLRL